MFFKRKPPSHRHPLQRRVRDLEVVSARLIRAGFAGDYHSAFHGRGIEFSQVREYLPGDDVRAIDWNVTARSGVPHVKEYVEERDLTILVAVDVSGSMAFGSIDWRKVFEAARPVMRPGQTTELNLELTRGEVLAGVVEVPRRLRDRLSGRDLKGQEQLFRVRGPSFSQLHLTRPGGAS